MIWCVTLNPALDVTYYINGDLAPGEINLAETMDARLGGKGNNVARTVRALGSAVTVVSPLGGFIGQELRQRAEQLNIAVLATMVETESRVCITMVSRDGGVTELRPPGPVLPGGVNQDLLERLMGSVKGVDWITLSGSLPRGMAMDTYAQWIRALKPHVAGIIVDAAGSALAECLVEGPSAIVPNHEEHRGLAGVSNANTEVIVTEGPRGVVWHSAQRGPRRWAPRAVNTINPVGAGDTFLGALVTGLSQGKHYEEAIPYAVAVASASVENLGIATFDLDRVRQIYTEIREVAP